MNKKLTALVAGTAMICGAADAVAREAATVRTDRGVVAGHFEDGVAVF